MHRKIIQCITESSFRTKILAVLPFILFVCITLGFSVAYSVDLGDGYSSGSGAPPECTVDTVAPPAFVQKIGRNALTNSTPESIAKDTSGNLYVTDSTNHRVLKYDASGNYVTQWGSYGTGDGQFDTPKGIAIDSSNNIYVADFSNHRIQKFAQDGTFLSKWGSRGWNNGEFVGPADIAVDSGGNIYVLENQKNQIQKFNSSGSYILKWGSEGSGNGQFSYPYGIHINSSNVIFVSDTLNNRIQKFDTSGTYLGKWGSQGSGDGQLSNPNGISSDSLGTVYVVDSGNNRIQKFDTSGTYLGKWGSQGSGSGQFFAPRGIANDSVNNVYVVDTGNRRVQKMSVTGGNFSSVKYATNGLSQVLNDDGTYRYSGTSGGGSDSYYLKDFGFIIPLNATVTGIQATYEDYYTGGGMGGISGTLQLVQDNTVVGNSKNMTLNTNNATYTTTNDMWGSSLSPADFNSSLFGVKVFITGFNRDVYVDYVKLTISYSVAVDVAMVVSTDGHPGQEQFINPKGVAVDPSGNIYVVDTGNDRIQKFDSSGTLLDEWGSTGSGSGELSSPTGITIDNQGNIYVTDLANRRIQKFDLYGDYISSISTGYPSSPSAITADDSGNIYVTDVYAYGNRVMKYDLAGSLVTQWGSPGSADGTFNNPTGIAVDLNGYVYVADMNNSRIQKFTSSGSFVSKWGSNGSSNGQFSSPQGVAVDSMGNVYVSEDGNDRIQKFDSSGNFISIWGSQGTSNGLFDNPYGLSVDHLGDLYVADSANNRIQKFTYDKVTISTPDGVTEGGNAQYYSVAMNTAPSSDVMVTLSVSNPSSGSSITVSPSTLTFTASNWNTPQEVIITPDNDATYTGNRSASISYSMSSVDMSFNCTTLSDNTVSIAEDESIPIVTLTTPQPAPTLEPLIANRLSGGFDANGECIMQRPGGKPDIFRIDMTDTKATLYIAPPSKPYTQFYITYKELGSVAQKNGSLGSKLWALSSFFETPVYADSPEYAIDFSHENDGGVVVYTINGLKPNTKYEFTIKCSNKCAFAETGNTLGASTIDPGSSSAKTYLAYNQNADTQSQSPEYQLVNAGSPAYITVLVGFILMILGIWIFSIKPIRVSAQSTIPPMKFTHKNPRIIRYT